MTVEEARPAVLPGVPRLLPVWVSLYGRMVAQARGAPRINRDDDAYRLFHARSSAMGWLHGGEFPSRRVGLWGMHDAEMDMTVEDGRFAWFHVGFVESGQYRPLSLTPLLSCVGSVLSRFGSPEVNGVQVGIGAHLGAAIDSSMERYRGFASSALWFGIVPEDERVPVTVTIGSSARDAGAASADVGPCLDRVAKRAIGSLQLCDEAVQLFDGGDPLGGDPARPVLTFDATMGEWSFDALGLAFSSLVDVGQLSGMDGGFVVSVQRRGS